ncbi:PEP-CTERM sorting domain-containing protein [Tunturiibacter lichenicola]|uniref:PEP-CTERM sorting domain-containing protein n=1 Tax=Tunturiibacter lichenicola TaxID=2051959 RepID=UPI003D9ABC05
MSKPLFTLALLASAFILPLAAHADAVDDFLITGNGNTITFSLPASPTDVFVSTGAGGVIGGFSPIPAPLATFNGVTSSSSMEFLSGNIFFVGPGIQLFTSGGALTLVGELLYSGSAYTPTFLTGTFDLHQFQAFPNVNYTLTITPESTPPTVPEPSALLLFATGAAGLLYRATKRPTTGTFL